MECNSGNPVGDKLLVRIAIVDDDEDIVSLLGEVVQQAGYKPDLFSNPGDALLAASSQEYDIVITDLQMPGVSGLDLLARVKGVFPLTQFIMITGYASVKSAAEAMHNGALSYLTKPLTSTQVIAHVDKAIERRLLSLENNRLIFELTSANEKLENKVQELKRMNDLLKKTQEDLVRVERLSAIGEVIVSINHSINNSISAIKAAVRFVKNSGEVSAECSDAIGAIDDECAEIEAVVSRLKSLRDASPADYVDGVKMLDLAGADRSGAC
jgi:FixJ family two-component response regulator